MAGRFSAEKTEPCINGRIVAAGAYFGEDVSGVVDRLLGEQMADGGWNCEQERGSVRGRFGSTINVLEGLLLYERAMGVAPTWPKRAKRGGVPARASAAAALVDRGGIDPDFTRLAFPAGYHYDVLRGLDYFRTVGGAPDERLG